MLDPCSGASWQGHGESTAYAYSRLQSTRKYTKVHENIPKLGRCREKCTKAHESTRFTFDQTTAVISALAVCKQTQPKHQYAQNARKHTHLQAFMADPVQNFPKECTNANERTRKRKNAHKTTRKTTKKNQSKRTQQKTHKRPPKSKIISKEQYVHVKFKVKVQEE